ncbi:intraflagellar transport protein 43 homolog A-like isoform X2 [Biomphalaria glabrata]|uniref:Intraflagellar transport protein 43 homolog A-like isoform X2 n=1 Tax=Biomphalaria glabrata TaxID=6526 RepID=A0A9W2ZWK4_BIOGL|nr:intraflagellar transport protein 43 homolog A-like isoform X2 [Biomphalaria glabrata]
MEADGLGLGFGTSQKKSAKSGRRAAQATSSQPAPVLDEVELSSEPASKKSTTEGRLNKAVSGWGEETPARKPRDRLNQKATDKDDDSESDIPIIPELEETVEEDLSAKVASAPNVAVNRVATYRELDNDLLKQAAFLTLDNDIDLKLLTKALSPPEDLIEDDKPWEWDRLFTEVSSELRSEWDKTDSEKDDEKPLDAEQ